MFLTAWGVGVETEMFNKKFSERGFIVMNVVFLTLIVSFAALIFLNGAKLVEEDNSALRLTALNLANEQFAEIEKLADEGNLSTGNFNFLGETEDLKSFGLYKDEDLQKKIPVNFSVTATVKNHSDFENLRNVAVAVDWTFAGKNFKIELEKIVRIND